MMALLIFDTIASIVRQHLDDKRICESYVAGMGIPAIGRLIGRSQFYVFSRLEKNGVKKRKAGNPDVRRPYREKPKDLVDAAVARYVAGESAKSISEDGVVSKATILKELWRRGITIRYQAACTEDQIISAYRSGMSTIQIEKEMGGTKGRASRVLKNAGIAFRVRTREKTTECRARWSKERSTAILRATPKWADLKKIRNLYKSASAMAKRSGVDHHVDHFYPLRHALVCGLHVCENLRIVTASENCKKNNFVSDEMLQWA
jgi:hypothetical protein